MKVALIGTRGIPPCYGGSETYVEQLALRLAEMGDDVVVYGQPTPPDVNPQIAQRTYPPNIQRVSMPSMRTKHLDNFTRSLLATLHVCCDPSVQVVQCNGLGSSLFAFLPRLFGKKVVGAIRAMDAQRDQWGALARVYFKWCEKFILHFPHATTTNSKAIQDYFRVCHHGHVHYIPNGADIPATLRPPQLIRRWGLSERNFILFVARLVPEKGCHTLIEAFQQLDLSKYPALKLAIAGGTSVSNDYTQNLFRQRSERVLFLDYVWGDALEELYSNALVFVLPSSIEGMSNALLSAMAHARPVLVSDIAENRAVIEDAATDELLHDQPGLTFPLGDAQSLAQQLRRLIENPQQAQRRGELLQTHIRQHFSLDTMRDRTRALYEQLLAANLALKKA